MKGQVRMKDVSKLKETKETQQLNTIHTNGSESNIRENATKVIIGTIDKILYVFILTNVLRLC